MSNRRSRSARRPPSPPNSFGAHVASASAFCVYARSSHPLQDTSVEQQIEKAEQDLWKLGLLPPECRLPRRHAPEAGVYVDDGVSAWKVPPSMRPGSAQLLAHMASNPQPRDRPGIIWVWALSRMLRAEHGGAEAIAQLFDFDTVGWVLYAHNEQKRLALSGKEAMSGALTVLLHGEKDSEHSREKAAGVRRGKAFQMERGFLLGGFAPVGYERWAAEVSEDVSADTGLPRVVRWIEPLPLGKQNGYTKSVTLLKPSDDADVVREIYSLYANGEQGRVLSVNDLMRRLNDGSMQHRDGRRWSRSLLHSLLQNEVYAAMQCDGDGTYHPALWEPLVERTVWDRAQDRLKSNATQRRLNTDFVLSGLIVCGVCGGRMSGERQITPTGVQLDYYRLSTFRKNDDAGRCPECRRRVRADIVEDAVLQMVKELATHPVVRDAVAAEQAAASAGHAGVAERVDAVQRKREDVRHRIGRLVDMGVAGDAVGDVIRDRLHALDAEDARLRADLEAINAGRDVSTAAFATQVADAHVILAAAEPAERREIIRAFVVRVELLPEQQIVRVAVRRPPWAA